MRSLTEVLQSSSFMREVSILLFGFAALSGLVAMFLLVANKSDLDEMATGVGLLVQAIVYLALGFFIRRGSLKALWIAGVLFALDTLASFLFSSETGLGGMIVMRGILIFIVVRYIRRQRMLA